MCAPFVMVAPNGARRQKSDHPCLPVTIAETVATAAACHRAGAGALHLHVRDAAGGHSLDAGRYREALAELARALPGMRVQITTEAAGVYDVTDQLDCLDQVEPDWASISVREIARAPDLADRVYGLCADKGTEVQHILYDTDDVARLLEWRSLGIVRPQQDNIIFVSGSYGDDTTTPENLAPFLSALPDARTWMLCAFGRREHECLLHAAQFGGDLRVGFENSLLTADGRPHRDNAASVAALVSQLKRIAS
ncbi:3-keto-5-aminohexanoate cleavage protein [Primorskyibacter sp. S87]|uniref:3-keto-5-aminohexanoate cleavage protein n=1 Tax=Primorskyibacter sp. S87 TaxID=3415126 RepID=UPI003C7BF95F